MDEIVRVVRHQLRPVRDQVGPKDSGRDYQKKTGSERTNQEG